MEKGKNLGNMHLHFKRVVEDKVEVDGACDLFHCFKCGFHPDVITTIHVKGFEE